MSSNSPNPSEPTKPLKNSRSQSDRPFQHETVWWRQPIAFVYATLLLASFSFLIWWAKQGPIDSSARNAAPADSQTSVADEITEVVDTQAQERARRTEFFQSQVLNNLKHADSSNRLAAKRCLERIERNFQSYRKGVDGFVDELLGLKSRFGILKRMPGGWWNDDERVSAYITEKFERHLFSEEKLTSDLREALEAFRNEVRANHRELLSRTRAAVEQSDLPPIELDDAKSFFANVSAEISELAESEAKTSVSDGLVTLVVSEAGSAAVGMIVGRLVTSIGVSTATALAASGGVTAGSAAAGAASGSLLPGPGTVVGFGVGLVIGFGIDYWMTSQTAAQLRTELLLYINAIETDLMLGPAVYEDQSADAESAPRGLRSGVELACDQLNAGVHNRLYEIIVLDQSL